MWLLLVFPARPGPQLLTPTCTHTHTPALFVCPQGLLPRAAPLSACPLLRLPPPLPRGTWASCWRVDFSSLCKQVVAACQVGRRQAGAALQPGCAKHRGTAWGGDGETPRERERDIQMQTDRPKEALLGTDRSGNRRQKIALYCPAQPHHGPGPLPSLPWPRAAGPSAQALGIPTPLLLLPPPPPLRAGYAIINL